MPVSVTYTPPYGGDFIDADPVTKTSTTPIPASVMENIVGGLSAQASAINALGGLAAAAPAVVTQAAPGGAYGAEPAGATVVLYLGDTIGPASSGGVTRVWLRTT